jgi:3',5'-cyclic AMP phosphodiesterase CpdA
MRIVHLSDLHVARFPRSAHALLDKRLLGTANYLVRRAHLFHPEYWPRALDWIARLRPELILCTGDVTCVGSPEEHEAAVAMLEPLRAQFSRRFLFVPGNHDAYVGAGDCRAALERTFRHLNGERWGLADLPLEWRVGGLSLLLLDAARPMPCLLSSGVLSADALAWLDERVSRPREEGECRVLICHFPLLAEDGRPLPRRRRMEGADAVLEHLQQGRFDVVLSGHVHKPFARWRQDGRGEVCAGSLTLNGCFNVLDWTPGTCHFRHFFVDVSTPRDPGGPSLDTSLSPVSGLAPSTPAAV